MKPVISLVIPAYNSANYIVDSLNSILSQTFNRWEAIIVDDGSTDETVDIINQFVGKDSRFKIFERNRGPKGACTCRNIALDHSVGEYVIIFDSDDILASFCLEQRVSIMENNIDLDFGIFPTYQFKDSISDFQPFTQFFKKNIIYCVVATDNIWQTMSPIYRRQFINVIGGFDEDLPRFQDDDFHLKALLSQKAKYEFFSEAKHDCYYRIIERDYDNVYHLNGVKGLCIYLKKILTHFEKDLSNKRLLKRAIKACFFKLLIYHMLSIQSNPQEIEQLLLLSKKKKILTVFDIRYFEKQLKIYENSNRNLQTRFEELSAIMWPKFHRLASYIQKDPLNQFVDKFFLKIKSKFKLDFIVDGEDYDRNQNV